MPVLYPNPNEQPTEYPDVEQTEPNADSEPTENPDAETVEVDNVDIDGDIDATTEQSTQQNDNENDTYDDTVLVESYRFGSGDNRKWKIYFMYENEPVACMKMNQWQLVELWPIKLYK